MPHPAASFIFLDESGVLHGDSAQPFFAIGAIECHRPEGLQEALSQVKERAIKDLRIHPRIFEFKFSRVTQRTLPYFREALVASLRIAPLSVAILLVDKEESRASVGNPTKLWQLYCECATGVVRTQLQIPERQAVVLCDGLNRPRGAATSLQDELRSVPGVLNVLLLESEASLLIQAIDLLVGCVLFDFRDRVSGARKDPVKRELADIVLGELRLKEFAQEQLVLSPVRFEILPWAKK